MIRAVESPKTRSACNFSLRLSRQGVTSFPALSRDAFLCLPLIKCFAFLVEVMVFALSVVLVVDAMIVFAKLG